MQVSLRGKDWTGGEWVAQTSNSFHTGEAETRGWLAREPGGLDRSMEF